MELCKSWLGTYLYTGYIQEKIQCAAYSAPIQMFYHIIIILLHCIIHRRPNVILFVLHCKIRIACKKKKNIILGLI